MVGDPGRGSRGEPRLWREALAAGQGQQAPKSQPRGPPGGDGSPHARRPRGGGAAAGAIPVPSDSRRESRAMSELIVITFDDEQQAGRALQSLRGLERQDLLRLNDTAVVVKESSGSVRVQNELSSATETGAV